MRKNILLLLAFMAFAMAAKAQIFSTESRADAVENLKYMQEYYHKIAGTKISKRTALVSEGKNASESKVQYTTLYDANGRPVEHITYNRKGRIKVRSVYKYDSQGRPSEYIEINKRGITLRKSVNVYDQEGNHTDKYSYTRKGKESVHNQSVFDAKGNLLTYKYLYNNDSRSAGWITYSYYPDGGKKQTISYDEKGKIQHVWNFECSPAGKEENKKAKDTTGVCIRYETDAQGNKLKIEERHYARYKTRRSISKYDIRNFCVETIGYDKKGKTTYRYQYNYDKNGNFISQVMYKPGGEKVKARIVNEVDENGLVLSQSYFKDKPDATKIIRFKYEKGS